MYADILDEHYITLLKISAYKNYIPSMILLGLYYTKHDTAEAINWYKKAVELGNTDAMIYLSYCYMLIYNKSSQKFAIKIPSIKHMNSLEFANE